MSYFLDVFVMERERENETVLFPKGLCKIGPPGWKTVFNSTLDKLLFGLS